MANISNITLPDNTNYGIRATGIMYGEVDSTSTSTKYTATITGITEYYDGLTIMLKNGIVTSTTNFTININGLGAKYCYNNMATGNDITPTAPTRDTTIFNINYTMLFVYSEDIIDGGAWICYRGYDANTNTIGYQLRTNSTALTVTDTARYYKLYFTSANNTQWVPASVNSTNNATSKRDVNQRPINPFGRIVYTSANTNYTAGSTLAATTIWDQYPLVLGYSFNRTGAALTLTSKKPVYVKCAPQSDGSAIMDADIPIVQDLPTAEDGKIYIYLGIAYDATHIELFEQHPVYYYKDGAIRPWTNHVTSGGGGTALTDQEIEDAVDDAFPSYSVTISLTNPLSPSYFESFKIYDRPTSSYEKGAQIGEITSPTGETTVNVSPNSYGIIIKMVSSGALFYSSPTCTGDVTVDLTYGGLYFIVTGDGTIVYDRIDWDD